MGAKRICERFAANFCKPPIAPAAVPRLQCPTNERFLDIAFLMPEPVRLGSLCVRKPGQEISCPANGVAQSGNASLSRVAPSWKLILPQMPVQKRSLSYALLRPVQKMASQGCGQGGNSGQLFRPKFAHIVRVLGGSYPLRAIPSVQQIPVSAGCWRP